MKKILAMAALMILLAGCSRHNNQESQDDRPQLYNGNNYIYFSPEVEKGGEK